MAAKEATIYIVDQGQSMGEIHNGRDESDLEYCMRYVWDKITEVLSSTRTTLNVGVLGLRTDETANMLADDEGYHHISIIQDLGPMKLTSLKRLQDRIRVNKTDVGDAISAIIIAIDLMEKFTKKLKYLRKIVLVTNGTGHMDADDIDEVAKKLNEDGIELVIL
jgi:ATP-dependent DNA helicase 2 subunit 2